jgi:hypothetical protein
VPSEYIAHRSNVPRQCQPCLQECTLLPHWDNLAVIAKMEPAMFHPCSTSPQTKNTISPYVSNNGIEHLISCTVFSNARQLLIFYTKNVRRNVLVLRDWYTAGVRNREIMLNHDYLVDGFCPSNSRFHTVLLLLLLLLLLLESRLFGGRILSCK